MQQTVQFNFTLPNKKSKHKLISKIIKLLSEEGIVDFSMSSSIGEEVSKEIDDKEEPSRNPNFLDWTKTETLYDLHTMTCKRFREKYNVSVATFYSNRKKRKNPFSHTRQEYSRSIHNPAAFIEEFGYSEDDLPEIQKKARKVFSAFYESKYPGVLDLAGTLADRVIGEKYGVSGATICGIRKMMGIEASQPQTRYINEDLR